MISVLPRVIMLYYFVDYANVNIISDNDVFEGFPKSYSVCDSFVFSNFVVYCLNRQKLDELINLYVLAGGGTEIVNPSTVDSMATFWYDIFNRRKLLMDCTKLLSEL